MGIAVGASCGAARGAVAAAPDPSAPGASSSRSPQRIRRGSGGSRIITKRRTRRPRRSGGRGGSRRGLPLLLVSLSLLLVLLFPGAVPLASAEIVYLLSEGGDYEDSTPFSTGLHASATRVKYLGCTVEGSSSGGGSGPARIDLGRLRVSLLGGGGGGGGGGDDDRYGGTGTALFEDEPWGIKEEISLDEFGYLVGYVDGDDGDGSGGWSWNGGGARQIAVVDVAVFKVPPGCAYAPESSGRAGDACDWPEVGVGATVKEVGGEGTTATTSTYYCCHSRAVKAGACRNASETRGRLILTGNFTGYHGAFSVSQGGGGGGGIWTGNVSAGTIRLPESGTWVVAFANCNDSSSDVVLSGTIEFESYYGYLPAELFPYMGLAAALAVLCSALFVWYLARMIRYAATRIPVEKWILAAIALAGLEACLQVASYVVWNGTGNPSYRLGVAAMVAGAFKSALGRCVLLTAALGWGVTKASLQCLTVAGVVLLGAATVPLELLVDLNLINEVQDMQPQTFIGAMWVAAEAADIVVGMEDFAYLVFALWTAAALAWTLWTLWRSRQTRKLGRYLRLSAVLLVSGLCAAVVVAVAQSRVRGDVRYVLLQENAERAIFVLSLAGVACLWRPNESAREYAYSTQLPTSEEDEQDGEREYDGGASDGLVLQQPPPAATSAKQRADEDTGTAESEPRSDAETIRLDERPAVVVGGEIELPGFA